MTVSTRRNRVGAPEVAPGNLPVYEVRRKAVGNHDYLLEVWQLPSPATPRLDHPELLATLKGTALRLFETRLAKRLARAGVLLGGEVSGAERRWMIDEELALILGLLFRALAPMRNLDRIRQVADGIDAMSREEAGYWLGMAMHQQRPRRVLAALRLLLDRE